MMSEGSQSCLLDRDTACMMVQSAAKGTDAGQGGVGSGGQWLERGLGLQLASDSGMLTCPCTSKPA